MYYVNSVDIMSGGAWVDTSSAGLMIDIVWNAVDSAFARCSRLSKN